MSTNFCCSLIFVLSVIHVIHRLSAENEKSFCGTIDLPLNPLLPRSRGYRNFGRLTIRLSAFYDQALLNKYDNNKKAVEEFIYRTVSSVSMSYRHSDIRQIADFSFQIKKIGFYDQTIDVHANGQYYRRKFCAFIKQYHFHNALAASVLFTGHNFKDMYSHSTSVQGLAHLNVACDWMDSTWMGIDPCTLVEGRQFKAAFIFAHELGHILGMNHDEKLNCGDKHIMSQSTGNGKTQWSECSLNQLNQYLTFLRKKSYWCLSPDNKMWEFPYEYKSTSADIQCKTALGPNFHKYFAWNRRDDICNHIVCTDNTFVIPIHPAMENTPCGTRMACIEGLCKRY